MSDQILRKLTADFWQTHGSLVIVAADGRLRFTPQGRAHFAPRLARCGFALQAVTDLTHFCQVMEHVTDQELASNTGTLERLSNDSSLSPAARASIARVLGA